MVTCKALTQGCWLATIHQSLPKVPQLSQLYTNSFTASSNTLGRYQPGSKSCRTSSNTKLMPIPIPNDTAHLSPHLTVEQPRDAAAVKCPGGNCTGQKPGSNRNWPTVPPSFTFIYQLHHQFGYHRVTVIGSASFTSNKKYNVEPTRTNQPQLVVWLLLIYWGLPLLGDDFAEPSLVVIYWRWFLALWTPQFSVSHNIHIQISTRRFLG